MWWDHTAVQLAQSKAMQEDKRTVSQPVVNIKHGYVNANCTLYICVEIQCYALRPTEAVTHSEIQKLCSKEPSAGFCSCELNTKTERCLALAWSPYSKWWKRRGGLRLFNGLGSFINLRSVAVFQFPFTLVPNRN